MTSPQGPGKGGLPPIRVDQANAPPGVSVSPGGAAGTFRGRLVIIFGTGPGTGLFVYDPAPATGTLIASIAGRPGVDPFGNPYRAGITSYGGAGQFISMLAAALTFETAGSTLQGSLIANASGGVELLSPLAGALDTAAALILESANSAFGPRGAGFPAASLGADLIVGTAGTPEFIWGADLNWVNVTITGPFANRGGTFPPLSVQRTATAAGAASSTVNFRGQITSTGAWTNGTTVATLAAPYRPSLVQAVSGNVSSSTGNQGGSLEWQINQAGAVQVFTNTAGTGAAGDVLMVGNEYFLA